jgi:tetratricopeptide (TPR) repeat protein
LRLRVALSMALIAALITTVFSGCSRDPNIRKQNLLQKGQQYFAKGKYREAGIEFVNAIKIDDTYAAAHYQLGQTYLKLQKWPGAFQEFTRTLELEPGNYKARVDLAKLAIETGDLQQAREQSDLLLQQRPNDSQSHFVAANLLAAQAKFAPAIDEMQKAIALSLNSWDLYMNLALMQLKNHQPDAAESNFKKAVELNPKELNASMMLGMYLQSRGRYAEAESEFRRTISIAPRSVDARAALVRLYLAEGKRSEAEAFLKQVKQDFPDNSIGYRMLGDFYFTNGDAEKATSEYASLYQQHPKDADVKKNYVELLIMTKQLDRATNINNEILKSSPSDNAALTYRGQLQLLSGDPNGAVETLQNSIKNDPKHAAAHYQLGLAYQALGNLQNAESEWREAIRINPDMLEAQRTLALSAMRTGDMNTLEQAATQMIALQPNKPEGYALRSISYTNQKKYSSAEPDIQKTIEVAPNSQLGYVQLGNLEFLKKSYIAAARAYRQGLDRDPESTDALRGLMNTFLAQNQVDLAVAVANEQISKAPANSTFYDLLGTTLFRARKDFSGAETALSKAIQLDPKNFDARIKLVQLQAKKGDLNQAIATCQQATKDQPSMPEFYVLLGNLYQSKQDWSGAKAAFEKARELRPGDPVVVRSLADVLLESGGNLDEALALAQSAQRSMPGSPETADTLGWVYYRKGEYVLALTLLQQALKLQQNHDLPDSADIHYHLGLTYEKTAHPALARQHLERALKINPDYSAASDIKKQLGTLKS